MRQRWGIHRVQPSIHIKPLDVPQAEADALIRLYNATGGPSWTDNTNWLVDRTVGNWFGVTVAGGHVTGIALQSNNLVGEWARSNLVPLTALEELRAYSNAALDCSFSLSDIPAEINLLYAYNTQSTIDGLLSDTPDGMEHFRLSSTPSEISGPLAGMPGNIIYFRMSSTPSAIVGALSDLPASTTSYIVGNTNSTTTGGATAMLATGIITIQTEQCSETQATVDDILLRLYTDRALFTYATPELNIAGNNSAPSGTYQDATPPTTGKEYAYKLENDPDAEGFNVWAITFTA